MTLPGLDAYLTREPDTRDDGPDPQREAEAAREQRWEEFVGGVRSTAADVCFEWSLLVGRVADAMDDLYRAAPAEFETRCRAFAETEGWPGVLSAVARAMTEQAAEAAEIERRR